MTVFATERLVVCPWTGEDAERILDMYSREDVVRYLGTVPRVMATPAEALAAIERWAARSEPGTPYGVWSARRRDSGLAVGTVGLVPLGDEGDVEVLWHLHPDSHGSGYATEAARGAIEHGFTAGLAEIYAVVKPPNTASLKVCRRLGMQPLGRTTRWYDVELEAFRLGNPAAQ